MASTIIFISSLIFSNGKLITSYVVHIWFSPILSSLPVHVIVAIKKNFKDFPHISNIFASLLGSSFWFQQTWVYNKPGWFNSDIKISIENGLDKDLMVQRSAMTMISYWETCSRSLHADHLINDTVDAVWAKLRWCDLDKDFTIKTAYRLIISKVTDMQGLELI